MPMPFEEWHFRQIDNRNSHRLDITRSVEFKAHSEKLEVVLSGLKTRQERVAVVVFQWKTAAIISLMQRVVLQRYAESSIAGVAVITNIGL